MKLRGVTIVSWSFAGNVVISPGPKFLIGGNLFPGFEIGRENLPGPWLRARIAGPPYEPVFNGRLYVPGNAEPGVIIDTFPKPPHPKGWIRQQRCDGLGYELLRRSDGTVLLGFEFRCNICSVSTNIFDSNGEVVALATNDGLTLLGRVPFNIPGFITAA
jgi:hypothetical protein